MVFRTLYTIGAMALLLSGCSPDGKSVNPPVEEIKSGVISSAETWDDASKVYRVTSGCSIEALVTWGKGITVIAGPNSVIRIVNNGILTVEENVTVRLCSGAYIEAGSQSPGTIIAEGSASGQISFKADTPAQIWGLSSASRSGGIVLCDSARNIRLNYCTISGASAGIYVKTGSPHISNCIISSCNGDGIYFDSTSGPADSSTFTNNTISGCGGYPLTLPADKLGRFSGEVVFSGPSGNKNAIHIIGAKVEDSSAIWKKRALPYLFSGMTNISSWERISNITIMPGVVCMFETGACIDIGDPRFGSGKLIARGTPTDSIFFINSLPGTTWGDSIGGIQVGMESPLYTLFEYCSIKNATNGIFVNPGVKVTVSHCRITGCTLDGIKFAGGSPVDSLAFIDNFCVGNTGFGISITANQLTNLSGTGSVVGNGAGGIYVSGSQIWESGTIKKHDAPYVVDGIIDIGTTGGVALYITPGTEMDFLPGSYLRVGNLDPGTLIAVGSANLPIIFKSFIPGTYFGAGTDGSSGGGIRIEAFTDPNSILSNCHIMYATSGVYVNAAAMIQNCSILNNQYYGLIRDKNANLTLISSNSYLGNGIDSTFVVP